MRTYDQKMAEKAFQRVSSSENDEKYRSFALAFPALIHTCGLAQAVSFAEAKDRSDYLGDLNDILKVLVEGAAVNLSRESREAGVVDYMRLTRRAVDATSWIKRYVQAFAKEGD